MVCMNCKKIVSDGLFCSICGWDQRKDPARCTLNEVHNRWKKESITAALARKGNGDTTWRGTKSNVWQSFPFK